MKVDRVLICMDFGPPAIAGARWVAEHFAPDAELTLLHVVDPARVQPLTSGDQSSGDVTEAAARADAAARMRELASYLTATEPRLEVRIGTPHDVILDVAAEGRFDLVVIGPHGEGAPRPRFLGTTADRVVRASTVPVLVATHPPTDTPSHVLVAVDERPVTPFVLNAARELAVRFGATITLLHVWSNAVYSHVASMSYATAHGEEESARADIARELNEAAEHWLNDIARTGIARERVTARVTYGNAGERTVETAQSMHADLLVLGRATASVLRPALLGSTIGTVLHAAPCPVLIVTEESGAAAG